jgi:asparagine synthase (glutamine-hydrolysing)
MCGIAGKVSATGPVDRRLVESMSAAQVHRGPDSHGIHLGEGVGLGIQRLAVIDLETGDQPIYNEDRSVTVILNGEIYNYRELRAELTARGHRFATSGDTEVIVHLYEELGPGLVERLAGMFCFALWDSRRRRLLIARDRVGKKPLHYYHDPLGSLTFASELGALAADPAMPREIDPSSLDQYLAYGYVNAPDTIWRRVRKLEPGHRLIWEGGTVEVDRWWQLDYSTEVDASPAELQTELRELIAGAVKRRLVADVPLGAFLSGGIDSAIVVSQMAEHSSGPVRTFSIGFEEEDFNELAGARSIAERFGTDHTEFTVRPDAVDLMPKLVRHYGEPYADSSAIPSFYLAELTRRHVTVALNGDGGDESFAGYLRYPAHALTGWLDHVPQPVRAGMADLSGRVLRAREQRGAVAYARRYLSSLGEAAPDRYAATVGIFDAAERSALLEPDIAREVDPSRVQQAIRGPWESATGRTPLDVLLQTDVETYLPGDLLTKMDIATMAYSLEARSPLLDHEVMEFAATLPPRLRLRGREKKWILREAYRGIIPDQTLDGAKRGFGVPLASWLRGDLSGWVRDMLFDERPCGGLVRPEAIRRLVEDHVAQRGDRSAQLWALLFLEAWSRELGQGT